jgi:hypothetical protein
MSEQVTTAKNPEDRAIEIVTWLYYAMDCSQRFQGPNGWTLARCGGQLWVIVPEDGMGYEITITPRKRDELPQERALNDAFPDRAEGIAT